MLGTNDMILQLHHAQLLPCSYTCRAPPACSPAAIPLPVAAAGAPAAAAAGLAEPVGAAGECTHVHTEVKTNGRQCDDDHLGIKLCDGMDRLRTSMRQARASAWQHGKGPNHLTERKHV